MGYTTFRQALELVPSVKIKNYLYKNYGDLDFKNEAKFGELDQPSFSNGASYADLDNDGDLDLVVSNVNEPAFIYKNNSRNNFLRLKLLDNSNKPVLGSKSQDFMTRVIFNYLKHLMLEEYIQQVKILFTLDLEIKINR